MFNDDTTNGYIRDQIKSRIKSNTVNGLEVTQCKGTGHGYCKRCTDKGIWRRICSSMLYQINGMYGNYCGDCVLEIKRDYEIRKSIGEYRIDK